MTKLRASFSSCVLGAALLAAGGASALDITIGDIEARNLGSHGFTANNSFLSFDGGVTDELYQMYGYLGNASGVRAVTNANFQVTQAISAVGNVATSSVAMRNATASDLGLGTGDLRIDHTFTLIDDTSSWDADRFAWDVSIVNLSGGDLDLVYYSYLDLDIDGAGDFGDDLAIANQASMVVSDPDAGHGFVWLAANAGHADHYDVQPYPQVRDLLDGLTSAQDLSDSGSNFGPGDFAAAYQYNITVLAGQTVTLSSATTAIPEPSTGLLTLLGLVGLGVRQRRVRAARLS